MVVGGLAAVGCAVLCLVGFVSSTVRAERLTDEQIAEGPWVNVRTSLRGAPARWLLAAVALAVVGVGMLVAHIAGLWS